MEARLVEMPARGVTCGGSGEWLGRATSPLAPPTPAAHPSPTPSGLPGAFLALSKPAAPGAFSLQPPMRRALREDAPRAAIGQQTRRLPARLFPFGIELIGRREGVPPTTCASAPSA
ncbi:hypothetical protein PCL_07751 [Purpureocillium lilacinum]|uniref:Uncharacterized protein n=1 Tax=Purpureocillium lilacinum TaxID=33203 RepID=A0A2U3EIV2_PURLI|nr:hypothetical protein PCL_07751 [Purpureocillium lilacinum]